MMERLGVLLTIVLHATSLIYAHVLSKDDLPLLTDSRELVSTTGITSRNNLWLAKIDLIGYQPQYVEDNNKHLRSRLISRFIGNFEGVGKPHQPQTQSSRYSEPKDTHPQVEQRLWVEYDEQGEGEVGDSKKYEEEYEKGETGEDQESEVNLFSPTGLQPRNNLEQFQQQNSELTEFKTQDLLNSQNEQLDSNSTNFSRVERPKGTNFSYMHPEEWSLNNPECSGRLQSPVNFDSDQLIGLDVPTRLIWTGYWNRAKNLTIIDNGHSVELSGTWDKETAPFISGGPLVGDYLFAQLHFHWGPKDSVGSEHTINNKRFPMEMHMVHYKKDYGTLQEALKYDDGLAVVAFLFEIGETSNYGINLLEDSLSRIQNKPRVKVPVKPYPLALLHFIFQEDYASYIGSLTTPPCREIVTWLVSSSPLTVSRKQLESFRMISNEWPDKENYRPRQALNGRHLYYVAH